MYCYEVLHDQFLENLSEMLDESIVAIQRDIQNWTQLGTTIIRLA